MPEIHHTMKRFPERVDPDDMNWQGAFCPDAKEYGPGAFSWDFDGRGYRYIIFRLPDGLLSDVHSVPVRSPGDVEGPDAPFWIWDGNEDSPTLTPSISIKRIDGPDRANWPEIWHGFITGGVLRTLKG